MPVYRGGEGGGKGGVGRGGEGGVSSVIDVCTQLTVAVETASGYRGD